jgi:dihydropteroate synthase
MGKSYIRPLGLVFGADAVALIAASQAGALGGLPAIGFCKAEIIERDGGRVRRSTCDYADIVGRPEQQAISCSRPVFAGLMLDRTRVMGIVNVTPDSFSDGGHFAGAEQAIGHGRMLAAEGADILDVGGESTRPGSEPVSIEEELTRVIPVIEGLSKSYLVSVDTRNAEVMRKAAAAGAKIVNDVSALRHDADSAGAVVQLAAAVVLMHAQGEPKTMQLAPKYDDVVLDVYDALEERIGAAVAAGISRDRIMVDPGIGFGKTYEHNLQLLAHLPIFHGLGVAVLVGLSRKAFVGMLTGEKLAGKRVHGSVGGALQAALMGAHVLRVHDVKATVEALAVFNGAMNPDSAEI